MTEVFKQEFYEQARKQRKTVLIIFFIVLGAYLVGSIGVLGWYLTLEYKSPQITTVKVVQYVITAVMVIFSFIYLKICYGRINKYYKQCRYMIGGIKETSEGYFFENDDKLVTKDGVDMKTIVLLQWNKFKSNYYERKVLIFYNVEFPKFNANQKVKVITVGNVLHSYEVLDEGDQSVEQNEQ